MRVKFLILLLILPTSLYSQESRVRELTATTADTITDDAQALFLLDRPDIPGTRKFSLAELKKTGVQVVNVKQHGAVGDGVADDTTAIQNVLSSCDGQRIYFPAGTYKITSTLQLGAAQNDFTIEGDGQNTVFASSITDGSAAIDLNGAQHFTLRNFKITNIANDNTASNFVGIKFSNANRWLMDNVTVYDCVVGVNFDSAYIGQIVNLFVRYCTTGFTATSLNDCAGVIKLENVARGFTITSSNVVDLQVLCEGAARSTTSTIDNCRNVKLMHYAEDQAGTLRTVPELTIGSTTRCSNIEVWLRSGNVAGPAKTFTADDTTNAMTSASHGFSNGTPVLITTTGTRPAPLLANVMYWVVGVTADTFQLSTSPSGSAIDITSTGSGTHTATSYPNAAFIALDRVNGCRVTTDIGVSNNHEIVSTTNNTKNLSFQSLDPTNDPHVPAIIPTVRGTHAVINYWPDPFFINGIPTLTTANVTAAEETSIVPPWATRSLKVSATGTSLTNNASRILTFNEYPQLRALIGKKVGVGWWQYFASDANYSATSNGNGPDCRLLTDGASPASTTTRWARHVRGKWHFICTEIDIPSDATQITNYYYANRGATISSDASMITYFVGPLVWIGGLDNAMRVMQGDYSHHPAALKDEIRRILSGSGSPESSVTAGVGAVYLRTDGGASTTLYIKESGTGNTGWVAK